MAYFQGSMNIPFNYQTLVWAVATILSATNSASLLLFFQHLRLVHLTRLFPVFLSLHMRLFLFVLCLVSPSKMLLLFSHKRLLLHPLLPLLKQCCSSHTSSTSSAASSSCNNLLLLCMLLFLWCLLLLSCLHDTPPCLVYLAFNSVFSYLAPCLFSVFHLPLFSVRFLPSSFSVIFLLLCCFSCWVSCLLPF